MLTELKAAVPLDKPTSVKGLFDIKAALIEWVLSNVTPENKQQVIATVLEYYDALTAGDTIPRLPDFIETPLEAAVRDGMEALLKRLLGL